MTENLSKPGIAGVQRSDQFDLRGEALAHQFAVGYGDFTQGLVLVEQGGRLGLREAGQPQTLWYPDFQSPQLQRRASSGGQLLLKALGGRHQLSVWDLTAGAGRDCWTIATYGFQVCAVERHPVLAVLLQEALELARNDPACAGIAAGLTLLQGEASVLMRAAAEAPAVALYDPMYPQSRKTALAKKDLQCLQSLIGADEDSVGIAEAALEAVSHRLVIKRPPKAPPLLGGHSHSIQGKAVRFDVYAKRRLSG